MFQGIFAISGAQIVKATKYNLKSRLTDTYFVLKSVVQNHFNLKFSRFFSQKNSNIFLCFSLSVCLWVGLSLIYSFLHKHMTRLLNRHFLYGNSCKKIHSFSNFSCVFLNPIIFFQFEFLVF